MRGCNVNIVNASKYRHVDQLVFSLSALLMNIFADRRDIHSQSRLFPKVSKPFIQLSKSFANRIHEQCGPICLTLLGNTFECLHAYERRRGHNRVSRFHNVEFYNLLSISW